MVKIGDTVIVTEQYDDNKGKKGITGTVLRIDPKCRIRYLIAINGDKNNPSWCIDCELLVKPVNIYELW